MYIVSIHHGFKCSSCRIGETVVMLDLPTIVGNGMGHTQTVERNSQTKR